MHEKAQNRIKKYHQPDIILHKFAINHKPYRTYLLQTYILYHNINPNLQP